MLPLPFLLSNNATHDILESAWTSAARLPNASERDFLREIHATWGLWRLAWALNNDLFWQGVSVSLTSVWIDHTPQCWFGVSASGGWQKPSCELADLLVVAWEDHRMQAGRAVLLQGKIARNPDHLVVGSASTKNELALLENSPLFLLSNQTSVRKGNQPSPYSSRGKSAFCLAEFGSNPSQYQHCRFLQIRHPKARRWKEPLSNWQAHWPASRDTQPYARSLSKMVLRSHDAFGADFRRNATASDWDALVNTLVDSTVGSARRGTAKGPTHTQSLARFVNVGTEAAPLPLTITFCPASLLLSTATGAALGARSHELALGSIDHGGGLFNLPVVETAPEPSSGMSILFITPHPHDASES